MIEVFSTQVTFGFEEDFKDQLSLRSLFKSRPPQVLDKDLFLFRHLTHGFLAPVDPYR
jgi:hypothetical protein